MTPTKFKVGQRVIGPWFSGIVVHFSQYNTEDAQDVFEQPEHHQWRLGVKIETVQSSKGFEPGSTLYFFQRDLADIRLSALQPE